MTVEELSSSSVTRGLATWLIGRKVVYYPRLASTMDTARRIARRGTPEGTVIIAGEQTRGRGRRQRVWVSPEGNVALSVILYPEISGLPYLVMIASLAVVHSIRSVSGLAAEIKWPNDILIGGKKVGGILIENEVKRDRPASAVIGIGINVSLKASEHGEITATGLNEASGGEISRVKLIRQLLVEIERFYLTLPDGESVYQEWRGRLAALGKRVTVTSDSDVLEGIAESVDGTGALMLRRPDGTLSRVVAGDVTLREGYGV